MVPNDFPYYFGDSIKHWYLWRLGCVADGDASEADSNITEDDIIWAQKQLMMDGDLSLNITEENQGTIVDVLHWENPPHLKSVPGIDHAHILCLRKG